MSDHIRQGMAFVIAMGMVIAVASAPTLAQVTEDAFEIAGLRADTVDGKDAVGAKTARSKRAGKLVATNSYGYLPSNIVRPKWKLIKGKPASFTDGRIGWYEVANKPAGFADNVDHQGVTDVKLTYVKTPDEQVLAASPFLVVAWCPAGSRVTGGGYWTSNEHDLTISRTQPRADLSAWSVGGSNTGTGPLTLNAYAVCQSTT